MVSETVFYLSEMPALSISSYIATLFLFSLDTGTGLFLEGDENDCRDEPNIEFRLELMATTGKLSFTNEFFTLFKLDI